MDAIRTIPVTDDPLWVRLSYYAIGPEDAALSFAARLARENGWTRAAAERVIGEYKRFCYLAVRAGHPVTPSDAVDQAWHLHLTYSRDYWERFCPEILGAPLHHGPTAGGGAEAALYYEQYALTLQSYARLFGEDAPADLWPDARRRFRADPKARRVHPRDGLFLAWPRAALLGALLAGLVCASVFLW
ncbi:MAG TPA: hypothetical protein VMG08_18865 [Allosphingosinicella sp.]|nr:hypothetical protein [Allosphingosinicella sp.]